MAFYCLSGAMAASQPSFQSPLWPGLCPSSPPHANHMRLPYEFITLTLFLFYGMKCPLETSHFILQPLAGILWAFVLNPVISF